MTRMRGSRLLSVIAAVLLLPMILTGCCEVCPRECVEMCTPLFWAFPLYIVCVYSCVDFFCPQCEPPPVLGGIQTNARPTIEQMRIAAIEFCENYPDECQQGIDAWVRESVVEAEE